MPVREEDTWLLARLREAVEHIERLQLTDYLRYADNMRRVLWVNFVGGVARGFGFAVGFTLLSAAALVMLERFSMRSSPALERFFDEVLQLLKQNLK